MNTKTEELAETIKLLGAMFAHNQVPFDVAMASLALFLVRLCEHRGFNEFETINAFAGTARKVFRNIDDTGEEGQN